MSSYATTKLDIDFVSGASGADTLSVALIGPDGDQRRSMLSALAQDGRANVSEFESYPSRPDEFRWLLAQRFDVIVLDLDYDPELALTLVERIKANGSATVMVYSKSTDTKLAVRFMRAGAREYLPLPLEMGVVREALDLAESIIHEKAHPARQTTGNLFVFLCAKGGSGVTTVACNLAVALGRETEEKTLLIDLALPMGDAALALGITTKYSTEDALRNIERLDARLLKELLVRNKSGAYVLAAPSHVLGLEGCGEAIDKLIALARREFDHVIVDLGSRMDLSRIPISSKRPPRSTSSPSPVSPNYAIPNTSSHSSLPQTARTLNWWSTGLRAGCSEESTKRLSTKRWAGRSGGRYPTTGRPRGRCSLAKSGSQKHASRK